MANAQGASRNGSVYKIQEYDVVSADASEVFQLPRYYDVTGAVALYLSGGAPTAPTFKWDAAAGTLTMTNHQAATSLKVMVFIA